MPFYEYECRSCKYYLEVMQKISEAPLTKCPSCGRKTLTKLISAPVFRLKGSGWYETDFKSDKEGQRNLAGTDREERKPEGATEGGANATKPAEGTAKPAEGAAKTTDDKAPARAAAVESTPGKRRAAPAVGKAVAPRPRAGARPRGKTAPAKGAAKRRSKR